MLASYPPLRFRSRMAPADRRRQQRKREKLRRNHLDRSTSFSVITDDSHHCTANRIFRRDRVLRRQGRSRHFERNRFPRSAGPSIDALSVANSTSCPLLHPWAVMVAAVPAIPTGGETLTAKSSGDSFSGSAASPVVTLPAVAWLLERSDHWSVPAVVTTRALARRAMARLNAYSRMPQERASKRDSTRLAPTVCGWSGPRVESRLATDLSALSPVQFTPSLGAAVE